MKTSHTKALEKAKGGRDKVRAHFESSYGKLMPHERISKDARNAMKVKMRHEDAERIIKGDFKK